MQLLVTCCNKGENETLTGRDTFLYQVDCETGIVQGVELELAGKEHGFTGLCRYGSGWLIAVQNNLKRALAHAPMRLLHLDSDLQLQRIISLEHVVDTHSILIVDGCCYLASTGNDSVISCDPESGTCEIYWRASGAGDDRHHVNSVACYRGELLLSCFGESTTAERHAAKSGSIVSIDTGGVLAGGIRHPHSLTSGEDRLWWCESGTGRVWCDFEPVLEIDCGYVRGLALAGDRLVVGVSRQRMRSRSSELKYHPQPEKIGSCALHLYRLGSSGKWLPEGVIPLAPHTDEVYELALF